MPIIIFAIAVFTISSVLPREEWLSNPTHKLQEIIDWATTPPTRLCAEKLQSNHQSSRSNDNNNPYQECLENICGPSDQFIPLRTRHYRKKYGLEKFDAHQLKNTTRGGREISQKIAEYYSLEEQLELDPKRKAELKDAILPMLENPVRHIELPTHGIYGGAIFGKVYDIMDMVVIHTYNDEGELIDTKLNEDSFKNIDDQLKAQYRELGQSYVNYNKAPLRILAQNSVSKYLSEKYGNIPLQDAITKYIDYAIGLQERMQKNIGMSIINYPFDLQELKIRAQNQAITSFELDQLVQITDPMGVFEVYFDYQDKYGREIAGEMESILLEWLKNKGKDELKALVEDEDEDSSEERERLAQSLKHSEEQCLAAWHQRYNLYPTQEAIEQLKQLSSEAKKNFIDKVEKAPGISNASKEKMTGKLDAISFQFPFSREFYHTSLIQALDQKIQQKRKFNQSILEITTNPKNMLTIMALNAMNEEESKDSQDETEDEDELDEEIADLCSTFLEQKPFSDNYTITKFGAVNLEYDLALGPPSYARQVIGHEMGHNLHDIIAESNGISSETKAAFNEVRDCLTHMQSFIPGGNDEMYSEEDFSDLAAFIVEDGTFRPFGCYFLLQNPKGVFFNDLSIANSNPEDDHSSWVLRILKYYVDKNITLPNSCQNALFLDAGILNFEAHKCAAPLLKLP